MRVGTSLPAVTVVIPCFNADRAGALTPLLADLGALVADGRADWDVMFVDDGSTDGTFGQLLVAARRDPWIKVLRHPTRLGTGTSLRTAFAHVRAPVVCTIDDRGTYPTERLPELAALARADADIAVGVDARPPAPGHRGRVRDRMVARLYARLTGRDGRTLMSPFRAYRRSVLDGFRIRAGGVTALAEILLRAAVAGHCIRELPLQLQTHGSNADRTDPPVANAGLLVLTASMLSAREARRLARTATRGGR